MKSPIKLKINEFKEKYHENYEWLYNGGDQLSDYDTLWMEFDNRAKNDETFARLVTEFCNFIGDVILSDREEAAFILTLHDMTD